MRLPITALVCVLGAILAARPAVALDFPTRPVHVIVPFTAGGAPDVLMRLLGQKLAEKWGQGVVVDNRAGGNTLIGTVAGAMTASNRYRMTGSKEIRSQIKKADGTMVDVTGRLKIDDDRVMVKSKKSGKTTITVGSAQGKVSPLDEHPVSDATIEVVGVKIVQTVCQAQ